VRPVIGLFMGFSALLAKEFVHCVLACTSPVAVRLQYIHSSTLGLLARSLRVIGQALQGCAQGCKTRIPKGVCFLCLAPCCTVLRSRWYQSGISPLRIGFPLVPHLSNI
jgi:hypothetical protein